MECKGSGGRVKDWEPIVALVPASPPIESVCCVLKHDTLFAA